MVQSLARKNTEKSQRPSAASAGVSFDSTSFCRPLIDILGSRFTSWSETYILSSVEWEIETVHPSSSAAVVLKETKREREGGIASRSSVAEMTASPTKVNVVSPASPSVRWQCQQILFRLYLTFSRHRAVEVSSRPLEHEDIPMSRKRRRDFLLARFSLFPILKLGQHRIRIYGDVLFRVWHINGEINLDLSWSCNTCSKLRRSVKIVRRL